MKAKMKIDEANLTHIDPENTRKGSWIQTFTGRKFYCLDPQIEDICIEDIAHSLSMLCRYNGHISKFYSVGEHCYLLSYAVPEEYALEALLHDASEAYTSDIPRPLKHSPELKKFREVEDVIGKLIFQKYGLTFPETPLVKEFDARIVANEKRALFTTLNPDFTDAYPPIENLTIKAYSPDLIEELYLERFYELTK